MRQAIRLLNGMIVKGQASEKAYGENDFIHGYSLLCRYGRQRLNIGVDNAAN